MRIDYEIKLGFKDVMIRPKRSTLKSRSQVDLKRTFRFRNAGSDWTGIPVMAANMDTVGTFTMARVLGAQRLVTAVHKHYTPAQWNNFIAESPVDLMDYVMVSTGTGDSDLDKLKKILKDNPSLKYLCIDVANGYSEHFTDFVKRVRDEWPNKVITAGNVVTGEMVEELILSGADIVKVGIGPGSICTTRVVTGVGVPQIHAITEVYKETKEHDIPIIADGGIKYSGDIAKAIAFGADSVMIGSLFAGTDESPGEVILLDGRSYKSVRGMGSLGAMSAGSSDRYFQEGLSADKLVPEGIEGRVPYRGPVSASVFQLVGGLRSAMGYTGCATIDLLKKKARFVKISGAGLLENHPHDVIITKESPNYQTR